MAERAQRRRHRRVAGPGPGDRRAPPPGRVDRARPRCGRRRRDSPACGPPPARPPGIPGWSACASTSTTRPPSRAAAEDILEAVGAPDGLVHNAGVAGVGCLEELPIEVWEQVFSTNFFGPVRLTKALLPSMRAAGTRADRHRVEPGRHPRHAVDRRLLRGQGRARTLGRVAVAGDRAVRPRRHRPRGGHVQDRHPRADPQLGRPRRSVRPAPRRPGDQRAPVPALRRPAPSVSRRRSRGRSTSGDRSPATPSASTPGCCWSAAASCPPASSSASPGGRSASPGRGALRSEKKESRV